MTKIVTWTHSGWAEQNTGCGRERASTGTCLNGVCNGDKEGGIFQRAAIVCFTPKQGTKWQHSTMRPTCLLHSPNAIISHNCKLFPCFEKKIQIANFKHLSPGHIMQTINMPGLLNHRTRASTDFMREYCAVCPFPTSAGSLWHTRTVTGIHPLDPF